MALSSRLLTVSRHPTISHQSISPPLMVNRSHNIPQPIQVAMGAAAAIMPLRTTTFVSLFDRIAPAMANLVRLLIKAQLLQASWKES